MIFNSPPTDWKDLQRKVCQIFSEIGCIAEEEKIISTVRGDVEIDVYVKDITKQPEMIYLCECKYWNNPIPQHVIHSFQTVVSNTGAHLGYIISKKGFQSGSFDAASNSNIKLLTWDEFQTLLFDTWRIAMFERIENMSEPFSKYMDFMSGPPRDADDNEEFNRLGSKYGIFLKVSPYINAFNKHKEVKFPIKCIDPRGSKDEMKEITITNYRDFFDILFESCNLGIESFENFRSFLRNKHGRD